MTGCAFGEKGEVMSAVEEFADAGDDRGRTCELITEANRTELERLARLTGGRTCADALRLVDSDSGDVSLEDVKIKGNRATVQETLTATTFTLFREGEAWKVDMLALAHLGWTLRQSMACSQFAADLEKLGGTDSPGELLAYLAGFERLVKRWKGEAEKIEPSKMYLKRHRDLMGSITAMQRAARKIRTDFADRRRSGYERGLRELEEAEKSIQDHPISCVVGT